MCRWCRLVYGGDGGVRCTAEGGQGVSEVQQVPRGRDVARPRAAGDTSAVDTGIDVIDGVLNWWWTRRVTVERGSRAVARGGAKAQEPRRLWAIGWRCPRGVARSAEEGTDLSLTVDLVVGARELVSRVTPRGPGGRARVDRRMLSEVGPRLRRDGDSHMASIQAIGPRPLEGESKIGHTQVDPGRTIEGVPPSCHGVHVPTSVSVKALGFGHM